MPERHMGTSDAAVARRNGWDVGTRLAGDEGFGDTVIEITAIGESYVLAKRISHAGKPVAPRECIWTFSCREWRVVAAVGDVADNPRIVLDEDGTLDDFYATNVASLHVEAIDRAAWYANVHMADGRIWQLNFGAKNPRAHGFATEERVR